MSMHDMTLQMILSLEFHVTIFTIKDKGSSRTFLEIRVHLNFKMFLSFVASQVCIQSKSLANELGADNCFLQSSEVGLSAF